MASSQPETPWYAAYPATRATDLASITPQELLELFKNGKIAGKDFALVDLRRNDFEGGTIQGSINLPAQSLYPTIPTLYTLFVTAGVTKVIWYCGSSRGRGSRAAGWFADHLQDQGYTSIQSLILTGGIKGWATGGIEYTDLILEYRSEAWK